MNSIRPNTACRSARWMTCAAARPKRTHRSPATSFRQGAGRKARGNPAERRYRAVPRSGRPDTGRRHQKGRRDHRQRRGAREARPVCSGNAGGGKGMILDELAAHARERVAADKAKISLEDMKAQAEALTQGDFRFEKALAGKTARSSARSRKPARPRASSTRCSTLRKSRKATSRPARTAFRA